MIAKRAAERWLRCRMRPIWRLTLAGSSRLLERSMRAAKRCQRRFDALAELVVHGLFFAAPVGRAAQDRGLAGLGLARELDLDALADLAPAAGAASSAANSAQLRLRRADDVAPAGLAQPRQVLGAGHAAVGDPDAARHRGGPPWCHDGLQVSVVGVAGEHFVAQRKAVEGHHQGDADLLAVGPVIAAE